ncbi:Cysteine protease atg4b [Mortierella sp. AD011]|nr:Cysteine protease atg4b [Mortierella sp. AD010]KAF9377665.1 Cysteine protease atg4b [Mortierella sp. AD011]
MDRIALDGTRTLGPSSFTEARSFEDMYAGTRETVSSGTSALSTTVTPASVTATSITATTLRGKGSERETGIGSSKHGGAIDRKHFTSTTVSTSRKRKNSHSRGDIEFWASLYAQHNVYTRQATKTTSESPMSSEVSTSNSNHYSNNHKGPSTRAPIKIWQVLTKTELDQHPGKHHRSRTKHENHESFQFERLPIKAPTASTATATALSSNGRPFSIVFFFTIEASANPVDSGTWSISKTRSRSRSKSSSSHAVPTTLWYYETAYTRLKTLHEHMELMGDFLPNGSNPSEGREVTPIYIYETQKLNFEQPRDQDAAVVLDLKLQSPEGAVYAEFSYTFVKDMTPEDAIPDSSRKIDITLKSKNRSRRFSKSGKSKMAQSVSSRESDEHDLESDEDFFPERPGVKDTVLDVVAEEPDAGEHFMQATSQFFSKMGYWLYNSKVVQYIARDDRVRTKTAFPADDIWMLGVCYQLAQEFPVEEKSLVVAANDVSAKVTNDHPQDGSQISESNPSTKSNSALDPVPAETPGSDAVLTATKEMAHSTLNSPKTERTSLERARYSQKMSLSQFAANPSQRSAPTSSISIQEAQSHSHHRSASMNTTAHLEDGFNIKSGTISSRTRTLSVSAVAPPKLSSTSNGNSKSAIATMATKISNMSISPKNSQSVLREAQQRDGTMVGGMASALGQEKDQIQEQSTTPCRKPGRRRMTISELFTWDNNSSGGTKRSNVSSTNGNSSNSVTALKSLVGSNRGGYASATLPVESNTKPKKQPLVLAEAEKTRDVTMMVSSNDQINPNSPQVQNHATSSDKHAPSQTTSELGPTSPATIPRERERRRKTSSALASTGSYGVVNRQDPALSSQPPSDSPRQAFDEGVILTPIPRSSLAGRDFIPRTSSPSTLSSPLRSSAIIGKRQSSMPVSPTSPKTNKRADGFAPSSPSPPPSPSPLFSSSSPGSTIKRSWRSLSLSLASTAKSALPSGLTSPIRPRSSQAMDNQRKYSHGAGFGHDYDGDDYDYSQDSNAHNSALISLPPSVITAMSLHRPPPPWAAAAFRSLSPEQKVLREFLMDFQSRLWFTYRKDLSRIEPSFYTCDSGWGCMMRTGQSLLAQAFVQVLLGREWRAHSPQKQYSERRYGEILDWFVDEPDRPYSIHRIAKAGLALDKRIGEWFGPSTVAHAMKRLAQHHADCPLTVLVPMENCVRVSSIVQAATLSQAQIDAQMKPPKTITSWRPVLLLIPTRYGLEKLTEKYIPNLKQLFRIPQFMGIAGGRPGRSLYFVACQGEELYYYDPHFVKPRVTMDELECCPAPSFHCPVVRSMDVLELDPSMLLGFLIQSPEELVDLRKRLLGPDMNQSYPLLGIQNDYDLERSIAGGDEDDTNPDNDTQQDGAQILSSSPDQFASNVQQHHEIDNEDVFSVKSLDSDEEEENEGSMAKKEENEGDDDDGDDDDDDDGVLV